MRMHKSPLDRMLGTNKPRSPRQGGASQMGQVRSRRLSPRCGPFPAPTQVSKLQRGRIVAAGESQASAHARAFPHSRTRVSLAQGGPPPTGWPSQVDMNLPSLLAAKNQACPNGVVRTQKRARGFGLPPVRPKVFGFPPCPDAEVTTPGAGRGLNENAHRW